MTNSLSPEQLQRKIAEVLGWKRLDDKGYPGIFWGDNPEGFWVEVPNWPGSRDVSKTLPIKDMEKFTSFMESVSIWGPIPEGGRDPRLSADKECFAWLLYKGWRWEICENEFCEGGEVLDGDAHSECGICSGEKGGWVHE